MAGEGPSSRVPERAAMTLLPPPALWDGRGQVRDGREAQDGRSPPAPLLAEVMDMSETPTLTAGADSVDPIFGLPLEPWAGEDDQTTSCAQAERVVPPGPRGSGRGSGQGDLAVHSDGAAAPLALYADLFHMAESMRIAAMNRLRNWLRDTFPEEQWPNLDLSDDALLDPERWPRIPNDIRPIILDLLLPMERSMERLMVRAVRQHPLWPWLSSIPGIGPSLAARLLYRMGDLRRFPSPAHLWSYAGLGGPGWKQRPHSWPLTSVCYLIAEQFVRHRESPYRLVYEQRKAYEASRPWCGQCHLKGESGPRDHCIPLHTDRKARRYTVKRFLKDLWRVAH